MMLVKISGCKSGREILFPTNYVREENTLWVLSWRERNWWKNLRGGAKVCVLLAGKSVEGRGQVIEEKQEVAQSLYCYFQKAPQYAKYLDVELDTHGLPIFVDCADAAEKLVMIQIEI